MVGLNSNIWYQSNKVNFTNPDDPLGQFKWLEQTLLEAKKSLKKVSNFKKTHTTALERAGECGFEIYCIRKSPF